MKIMVIMEMSKMDYDKRHGGPWDRGTADSWYSRGFDPHYYPNGSYEDTRIELKDMTAEHIVAYSAGYEHNEKFGGKKSWD